MVKWLLWAGIAFIVGGVTSLGMTLVVEGKIQPLEDTSSYSIGWIIVGMVLIIAGFTIKSKKEQ